MYVLRFILILLLSIAYSSIYSQETVNDTSQIVVHTLDSESGILISAKNRLPFWLKANNSNRFTDNSANSLYQVFDYNGNYGVIDNLRVAWELESIINVRESINGKFIQANISIQTNFWRVRGGYKEEFFGLNDSTLSIGNLVYGNNARPIPKFSISTNGWQKAPFLKNTLSYQGYIAHGKLEQNRFQSGAFLHQKYFYIRAKGFSNKLSVTFGLNHNAQWGGSNSLNETSQPIGIRNYTRIFLGSSGGGDALPTDQQNALGNHLGSYDMRGSFEFKNLRISNYWQFLWEDKSGLTPFNWRDGMTGISIERLKKGVINKLVLEIVRTNDQNAQKVTADGIPFLEPDNFLNNSVYKTGWSYHNRVIGSSLFLILNDESLSSSRIKNSINAINVGIRGDSGKFFYALSYVNFKNKGTKSETISPSLRIKFINISLEYRSDNKSSIGSRINYQTGNIETQKNFTLQFFYRRTFFFGK